MQQPFALPLEGDLTIRGNVHLPDGGERLPLLLFCHGFKGFKDWGSFPYAADELAKRGIAVIRFNFSCNGVGESLTEFDELDKFSVNTYARELADLKALADAVSQGKLPIPDRVDSSRLFVLGHSKGGGDAILFAARNPLVKGVITWNGIANVNSPFDEALRKEIAEHGVGYVINGRTGEKMPITRTVIDDLEQHREEYDLIARVAEMEQPLLIVQGDEDYPRLVKGAQELHRSARNSTLHWIKGGGHTWNTRHPFDGTTDQLEEAIEVTARFVLEQAG